MANDDPPSRDSLLPSASQLDSDWPEIVRKIRARTPARVLAGRVGTVYRTATQLDLREAHAAARDAVRSELDLEKQFAAAFIKHWGLFEVSTEAHSKDEYLLRPSLGRSFPDASRSELMKRCPPQPDLQIAIGDGLSVTAVFAQVPKLLPALWDGAKARGWTLGQVFVIRHCRVGILNQIGELLSANRRGAFNWRAAGTRDCRELVSVYGVPAPAHTYRCRPKSDFEYPRPRS